MNFEISVELKCSECSRSLEAKSARVRGSIVITVVPCATCIWMAADEAKRTDEANRPEKDA